MGRRHWWAAAGALLGAGGLALAGTAAASPAQATVGGAVSVTPASGTPQLSPDGTVEQVRQLVQCGGTMYAVGKFTEIKKGSTVYARNNVFSFRATSPYTVTSWNPDVNGAVSTIAFNGTDCSHAYIGGKFTSVHGTAVKNIAEIDTSTGAVVPTFRHTASGQVLTIRAGKGHLLTGGYFSGINGSSRRYFASLSPVTGQDDGFVNLNISGTYQYCYGSKCAVSNSTRIFNQQISHSGTLDLVEGDFTSVGGQPRQQAFTLDLSGAAAAVTGWTSPEFSGHCWFSEPFYIQAGSWSPDDSTIYLAATGYRPYDGTTSGPRSGLCDSASAWSSAQTSQAHKWINYTGCDSLYSTAADGYAAYFGGHERWSMNPSGCDQQGPGAVAAPGMEGLSPANGSLTVNPTRGRGLGADDMLVTSAGLWIASDNASNTSNCGKLANGTPAYGHAGICLLPY
jgi:hypothetical protein